MAKNFAELTTDTKQKVQRVPSRINTTNSTPRQPYFKLQRTEDKEKILKEAKWRENLTYRGTEE